MGNIFYLMLSISIALAGYNNQMSDAAPITVDGSEAIAPSVDFEPEVVSCDRYEQIVELPKEIEIKFKNRTESQYGMEYITQQKRSTKP